MTLNICSTVETHIRVLCLCAALLSVVSCAPKKTKPEMVPPRSPVPIQEKILPMEKEAPVDKPAEKQPSASKPAEKDVPAAENQSPRLVASLELTQQARQFIENQDADNAIRILEKALVVDPSNGQNYYYLSEAWLMKGNIDQAVKFNELAEIHLADQIEWTGRLSDQKRRIYEKSGLQGP
jgi:hypothetical protein